MKLEVGKRYVLRNGYISGVMRLIDGEYPFYDGTMNWASNGSYRAVYGNSPFDIVAEYVEPQPQQQLRWVENCKPDKPGIWAWKSIDGVVTAHYYSPRCSLSAYAIGTWCYLGPIPEILPPKKKVVKVVERLWVNYFEPNNSSVQCAWFCDGGVIPEAWIRTDRTREREI